MVVGLLDGLVDGFGLVVKRTMKIKLFFDFANKSNGYLKKKKPRAGDSEGWTAQEFSSATA
jgi:hypothetical protein